MLAREGAFGLADPDLMPPRARVGVRLARTIERRGVAVRDRAERLTVAFNRLGPSWVKLGQFLATRPDLVGPEAADGLGKLRDEIAPFSQAVAEATVVRSLGKPLADIFSGFSASVAAASIAQVHRAEIVSVHPADGPPAAPPALDDLGTADVASPRFVAVKVLRPDIRRRFARDLDTFYAGAAALELLDPGSRRLRPRAVVDTLSRSVTLEMDLRMEAAALAEMAGNIAGDAGFRVPAVDWQRTSRDVLTLEWIDGIKLSDVAALKAAGHDLAHLARELMRHFLRHAVRDGFFHADMHQGNLFIDREGLIVAVDFGIMGRLGKPERRFLAEILFGFLRQDYRRVAEVHIDAGYVPPHHSVDDFAQALRAIGAPIHGQPARDISMARLLMQLLEVTDMFDMQTRPELVLLQKTMVVVEGVSRSLDPDFDMWSASEPVLAEWAARHLGPVGALEDAVAGAGALTRLLAALPELASGAERVSRDLARMTREGPALAPETVAMLAASERRRGRWTRAALWLIAAAAVVIALKL